MRDDEKVVISSILHVDLAACEGRVNIGRMAATTAPSKHDAPFMCYTRTCSAWMCPVQPSRTGQSISGDNSGRQLRAVRTFGGAFDQLGRPCAQSLAHRCQLPRLETRRIALRTDAVPTAGRGCRHVDTVSATCEMRCNSPAQSRGERCILKLPMTRLCMAGAM